MKDTCEIQGQEPQQFDREAYYREMFNNMLDTITHLLKPVPTVCLVRELERREGVTPVQVLPYKPYELRTNGKVITDSGPATILIVID